MPPLTNKSAKLGANCRCDCDGYRPDTLGGGIEFVAVSPPKKVSSGETAESHPTKAKGASKLCHRHGVAYWIS